MYGKFFASTFTGSMVGAGLNVFALWGYIIANARKDGTVELNPPIIAATLGCPVGEVQAAIQTLTSPDPNSRSKKEEGRRIIQSAAFLYFIPTHADYQAIRDDAGRQEYMREYMREYRAKGKPVNVNVNSGKPPLAHIDVDVDIDVDKAKKKATVRQVAPSPEYSEPFLSFWANYPNKKGKAEAFTTWVKKNLDGSAPRLIAHVAMMGEQDDGWQRGYVPMGSTYLNQSRWEDEPKGAPIASQAKSKGKQAMDLLDRIERGESL